MVLRGLVARSVDQVTAGKVRLHLLQTFIELITEYYLSESAAMHKCIIRWCVRFSKTKTVSAFQYVATTSKTKGECVVVKCLFFFSPPPLTYREKATAMSRI